MMLSSGEMMIAALKYVVRVTLYTNGKRKDWYLNERMGFMLRTEQGKVTNYSREDGESKARECETWYNRLGFFGTTAVVIPQGWAHI